MGNVVIKFDRNRAPVVSVGVHHFGQQSDGVRYREALIDTGAVRSFIDEMTVTQLGLSPTGETTVMSPLGSMVDVLLFPVSFRLVVGKPVREIAFAKEVEAALLPGTAAGWHHLIVGRDVLNACKFSYDGPAKSIAFDRPSRGLLRKWLGL